MPKFELNNVKSSELNRYLKSLALVSDQMFVEISDGSIHSVVPDEHISFLKITNLPLRSLIDGVVPSDIPHIVIPILTMKKLIQACSFFTGGEHMIVSFECFENDFDGSEVMMAQAITFSAGKLLLKFETNDIGGVGDYYDTDRISTLTDKSKSVCQFNLRGSNRQQVNKIARLYPDDEELAIDVIDGKVHLSAYRKTSASMSEDDWKLEISSVSQSSEVNSLRVLIKFGYFKMMDDEDYVAHLIPTRGEHNLILESTSSNTKIVAVLASDN